MKDDKMTMKHRLKNICIMSAVILVVTVVLIVSFQAWKGHKKEKQRLQKGVTYLESLEQQNVEEIRARIDEINATISDQLAEMDENAMWASFDQSVILGDSRAVGFSFYEFLPENRVLARGGGRITDIKDMPEYLKQVKELKPKNVFLCYGLNDIEIGFWPVAKDYAKEFAKQAARIKKELPDCEIYINSILPAVGEGLKADPDYARIGEYNEALRVMAEEKGYHFVDNSQISKEHENLYQPDGLHILPEFYKYWAMNMLTGVSGL